MAAKFTGPNFSIFAVIFMHRSSMVSMLSSALSLFKSSSSFREDLSNSLQHCSKNTLTSRSSILISCRLSWRGLSECCFSKREDSKFFRLSSFVVNFSLIKVKSPSAFCFSAILIFRSDSKLSILLSFNWIMESSIILFKSFFSLSMFWIFSERSSFLLVDNLILNSISCFNLSDSKSLCLSFANSSSFILDSSWIWFSSWAAWFANSYSFILESYWIWFSYWATFWKDFLITGRFIINSSSCFFRARIFILVPFFDRIIW